MTNRRRRGLAGLLAVTALAATSFTGVAPSVAQEPPPPPPTDPNTPAPMPGYEEFAGCPVLVVDGIRLCLAITVNGDIQIGKVNGQIQDLKMVLGAAAAIGSPAVLVPAPGGSGPAPVKVSGGILGIPTLDPLLELDVLNLLSLSATPQLGELQQTGLDTAITFGVLAAAIGFPEPGGQITPDDPPYPLPAAGDELCIAEGFCIPYPELGIGLPLNLKLNNLLLGPDCNIGPIDLALTTGTTAPPEGVAPITGSSGELGRLEAVPGSGLGGGFRVDFDNMEFVGNSYPVPGSDCGGIAGAGDLVEGLGLGNPLETLINNQAGLPAGAGASTSRLTVDLHVADQALVYGPPLTVTETDLDFGDVPVGQSKTLSISITNNRTGPRNWQGNNGNNPPPFSFSGCNAPVIIGPGETCTLDVTFTPVEVGPAQSFSLTTIIAENLPAFHYVGNGV